MRWSACLSLILVVGFGTSPLVAGAGTTSTATWTGASQTTHNWTDSNNWETTGTNLPAIPANDGTLTARFPASDSSQVNVNGSLSVANLLIYGTIPGGGYTFLGPGNLTLGSTVSSSAYDVYGGGSVTTFDGSLNLIVNSAVTFSSNTEMDIYSPIAGTGSVTYASAGGALYFLDGYNTYTGGTIVESGASIYVANGNSNAFGNGTITLAGGQLFAYQGALTLANPIAITSTGTRLAPSSLGALTLTGQMTLGTSSPIIVSGSGYAIYQTGGITESTVGQTLSLTGAGSYFVLSGTDTYTGGTYVANGSRAIFTNLGAIPTLGAFTSNATGYIGTTLTAASDLTTFLGKFSPTGYIGTIGFDTTFGQAATPITSTIDLTSIPGAVIGSASTATLSGTINTGNTYKFGGGGGSLTVTSNLTDNGGTPRSLSLQGNGNILTLHLSGTNTYTGGTTVTAGALIFDTMSAVPTTGLLNATSSNSYIGTSQALDSVSGGAAFASTFLGLFNKSGTHGIVGFDSTSGRGVVSANLNLSSFASGVYLGTTSAVTLDGTISTADGNYYFTGVKGGALEIGSILGNQTEYNSSVTIGTPSQIRGTDFVNGGLTTASVTLDGANTYTGGTKLDSGKLILANAGALGSGALTVASNVSPSIANGTGGALSLPNNLILGSNTILSLDNAGQQVELQGSVTQSGTGAILALYGSGSTVFDQGVGFAGPVEVTAGTAVFTTAPQSSVFDLVLASGATANFTNASSYVSSLADLDSSSPANETINLPAGGTLHISEPSNENTTYNGILAGGGSTLEKSGGGFQSLGGANTYTGGTVIDGGVLAATGNGALGTGLVTINSGAKLGIGNNVTLSNPLSFSGTTSSKATLGGFGTYVASGTLVLPSGSAIAPGANTSAVSANANATGPLTISGSLNFLAGSTYDWGIQTLASSGGSAGNGWGVLVVTGSASTSALITAPYTLRISSFDSTSNLGSLAGFDNTQAYSWTILTAGTTLGASLVTSAAIDTSQFSNALGAGSFYLSESGTNLILNFTPVPEPSTYGLLALGLGLTGAGWMIRRRRSV